ncbi:DUF342 domain-containing protein [uncultured Clostridium sp.]|uniref:DUF342 domain-containing protein n=1 Tax=uncultured Clostridium sp. TaxID=59620 RepID=UPI0025D7FA97|nr:FapA family protein [uncultured Clostridium sp.]
MNLIFSAGSINECLDKASEQLNISKDDLQYKVIKEERRFFKKYITIEILEQKDNPVIEDINVVKKENGYGAEVRDGKILINSSDNEEEHITIRSADGIELIYNGEKTDFIDNAKESDIIEYSIIESPQPVRKIDLSSSKDKMEAYITIKSTSQRVYKLEDTNLTKNLVLKRVLVEERFAPKYTYEEIKKVLKEGNIVFGILEDKIKEVCNEDEVENVLIAKGVQAVDDTPEKMEILFKDFDRLEENAETEFKIDYRNRFMLATVKTGEEIARIIPAVIGKDGRDVYGNDVKHKDSSNVKFKAGEGCRYENNKIIATLEGKPSFKSNTFKVHQVYQVDEVNLSTGNINFVADVEVAKTVQEGMEITAGHTVFIGGNVESAKISAASHITIDGNILNSTVSAGESGINKKKYLMTLNQVKDIVDEIYSAVIQVGNNSILGERTSGEIIKILIENKYKTLVPLCEDILSECKLQGITNSPITSFINRRIIGFGPLNIKQPEELLDFVELLKEESDELESFEADESNVYVQYIQGSKVEAIGNVFVQGKGEYTSEITALNNIEFTQENSICRGGILSAGKEIRLKTVGSEAGVNTILKVPKKGVITADIAYSNTTFCFGDKQLMLDAPSRNVKAYVDSMGDIEIEKLLL